MEDVALGLGLGDVVGVALGLRLGLGDVVGVALGLGLGDVVGVALGVGVGVGAAHATQNTFCLAKPCSPVKFQKSL